jgi:uncharacterized protein
VTSTSAPDRTTAPITESTVTPTTLAPTTTAAGDLVGWQTQTIEIDGAEYLVAVADDEVERAQGLMEVDELGEVDGMLFSWSSELSTGFWMKGTLMSLDLAFFDSQGRVVDQVTLEPCSADPCPVFVARAPFQWVLESIPGTIHVGPDSVLGPLP